MAEHGAVFAVPQPCSQVACDALSPTNALPLLKCPVATDLLSTGTGANLHLTVTYYAPKFGAGAVEIPFVEGVGNKLTVSLSPPSPPMPPSPPPAPSPPPPGAPPNPPPPHVPPPRNLKLKVRMQNTNSATNLAAAAGLPAGSGSYPYSANRGTSHGVKAGAYADGEYIHLNTDCASGQYACQAKDVCQQMTGWACQHQSYSCNGGSEKRAEFKPARAACAAPAPAAH